MNKTRIVRMPVEKFHELVNSAQKITMLNLELEGEVERLELENKVLSKEVPLENYVEELKRNVSEQGMLISSQIQQICNLTIKLSKYTETLDNVSYVQVQPMTEEEQFEMYSRCEKEQLISMLIESNKNLELVKGMLNPYYVPDWETQE